LVLRAKIAACLWQLCDVKKASKPNKPTDCGLVEDPSVGFRLIIDSLDLGSKFKRINRPRNRTAIGA